MTVGELRNKIAGVNPNIPVILYLNQRYYPVRFLWQNHIKADLSRDATVNEAVEGEGITGLVVHLTATQTARQSDEERPTPPFRGTES